MTESRILAQRAAVVAEAETWIGTSFHHEGRIKGAGVDCAQLLYATFLACKLIPPFPIAHYPPDWHFHNDSERYLGFILDHAVEVERDPLPGDVVLWRFGRCYSHGGIVKQWPLVVHVYVKKKAEIVDVSQARYLQLVGEGDNRLRPMKTFTLKAWL